MPTARCRSRATSRSTAKTGSTTTATGRGDCADSDCAALGDACVEVSCRDGVDNDTDGALDCDDADCADAAACVETCDDGADNDRDGAVDCFDADCSDDARVRGGERGALRGRRRQRSRRAHRLQRSGLRLARRCLRRGELRGRRRQRSRRRAGLRRSLVRRGAQLRRVDELRRRRRQRPRRPAQTAPIRTASPTRRAPRTTPPRAPTGSTADGDGLVGLRPTRTAPLVADVCAEASCADGADNDRDGLDDCADPACATFAARATSR